jgi:hypothetical protein
MSCKHCNSGPFRSNIESLTEKINIKDYLKKIKSYHFGYLLLFVISVASSYWLFFYDPKVDYCYTSQTWSSFGISLMGSKKYVRDTNYGLISKSNELNKEIIENAKVISKELGCEFKIE